MSDCAIILAGGSGSRMRGVVRDKVLEELLGLPVILHSFKAFADSKKVDTVVFVCRDDAQQAEISKSLVNERSICYIQTETSPQKSIKHRGTKDEIIREAPVVRQYFECDADAHFCLFVHPRRTGSEKADFHAPAGKRSLLF